MVGVMNDGRITGMRNEGGGSLMLESIKEMTEVCVCVGVCYKNFSTELYHVSIFTCFSSTGCSPHISWSKCCLCVSLYVCLGVNQGGTNCNRWTESLVILHAQTH